VSASILNNPGFYMTYALVQAVFVLLLIRFLDLYEREPLSLLALMALWGATGAAALSLLGNDTLDSLLSGDARTVFASAVSPPLVEESAKGVALVAAVILSRWVGRRFGIATFEGLTDGIVYGAAVGLGFAFTEDFFYFLDRARSEGLEAGLEVFQGRRDFFGPAVLHHALFTAAFGAGLGLATWARRPIAKVGSAFAGFAVAVTMHAVNNGLVEVILTQRYGLQTTAAWARDEPVPAAVTETADDVLVGLRLLDYLYIAVFVTAVALWLRYQRRVIRSELLEEVESGLVDREDWALVTRYRDRSARYWRLLRSGQMEQWRLLRKLHGSLVELALLKWRVRRYGGDWELVQRARRMIATVASFDARPTNLPAELGRLIGRGRELDEISRMLAADPRLVTLTGPGGVGKTRLALHVAERLRDSFAGGVFFVPRIARRDPALLLPAIAQTLDFGGLDGGQPESQRLGDFLRDKQLLLVVDSFEQAIAAGPEVVELLASAPRLKVLATSRQALRVSGEHEYPVPPLSIPPVGTSETPQALRDYGAVELFLDRARAVTPSFELTSKNAPAIAGICRHLEGLPLAISLAAGRVRVLAPEAILERLKDPLGFLTGGERDATVRHQTLAATIEWSYGLLDPREQRLFARLAVFVGGCTLDAAETVCARRDLARPEVLDGLSSLIEKNLVRRLQEAEAVVEPRFAMLETIREYALQRLAASGELSDVRAAHGEYYLALAETTERELVGAQQVLWARRLEEEYENFRAVLSWAILPDRVERLSGVLRQAEGGRLVADADPDALQLGLRLSEALARIWEQRGHITEARRWVEAALAAGVAVPGNLRARALLRAGRLAQLQSDYDRATAALEEALALLRRVDDGAGEALALAEVGWIALVRGEHERSRELLSDGVALARRQGDKRLLASLLNSLGRTLVERGELPDAGDVLREGLAIRETLRDKRDLAASFSCLGRLELVAGRPEDAVATLDRALSLSRDVGATLQLSDALYQRSAVADALDDPARSAALLQERLLICRELGDRLGLAETLDAVPHLGDDLTETARAVRLVAAAEALRASLGAERWPFEQSRAERLVAAARSRLGKAEFDAAWAAGALLSAEEAFREASEPVLRPVVPRQVSQALVAVS
jgi:predicted ATPase/RsiW-degrading membrane proteinase PrsW (M82 family)